MGGAQTRLSASIGAAAIIPTEVPQVLNSGVDDCERAAVAAVVTVLKFC